MKSFRKMLGNAPGFTLVEVLIAAILGSIAVAAGFELFINQNKNHIIQTSISDMQQNGRAAIDELVEKVRQAGYRVPPGVPILIAHNTDPDTITICFLKEPLCTASLTDPMPQPSAELKLIGYDLSCFQVDTWAYIYDPVTRTGEFFFITQIQQSDHIQHNLAQLSKKYQPGAQVYVMNNYKYYVDHTSDSLHPRLMLVPNLVAPVIYADNIEDLDFRYVTASNSVADTIAIDRYVREVMIELVARTEKNDLFMNDYRRDTLSSRVMVRNLAR